MTLESKVKFKYNQKPNYDNVFLVDEWEENPNTNKIWPLYDWPASEAPFKWRLASGPMMAQYGMLA